MDISAETNSTIIQIVVRLQIFEHHNVVFVDYSDVIIMQLTHVSRLWQNQGS